MNQKLFLVSNREYSDGDTLAIFSTREKAEEYVAAYNFSDCAYCTAYIIDEFSLDQSELDNIGKYSCRCYITPKFEVKSLRIELFTANSKGLFNSHDYIGACPKYFDNEFTPEGSIVVVKTLSLSPGEQIETKFAQICSNIMRAQIASNFQLYPSSPLTKGI